MNLPLTQYIFGILAALFVLAVVIEMLRRRRLRERHAVWWLLAGVLALVIGIFPQTLRWASDLVGIEIPTNLVFFVSLVLLFFVCLQHSAELTELEAENRALAEALVLLDLRVRNIEPGSQSIATEPSSGDSR